MGGVSILKAVRTILTLKCSESTRLVSMSLDGDLPTSQRIAVRVHALICRSCRVYRQQMLSLREAWRRVGSDADHVALDGLSPESRSRIESALRDRISGEKP